MTAAVETVPVSLTEQIAAVEREVRMRRRVYPRWVESGKLTAGAAEREIAAMEATAATLRRLAPPVPEQQGDLLTMPDPHMRGEPLGDAGLTRLTELLADAEACPRLTSWETDFLADLRHRVRKYGTDTAMSSKASMIVKRIKEKVYATA